MSEETYDPDAILRDPTSHPIHRMYAAINIDVRDNGARWAKCPNCGDPFRVTAETGDTVCSDRCEREFAASLYGGL